MPSSTITSRGQTTIPKDIRRYLGLRPGNRIDYVIDDEGRVVLRPATYDVRDLHGVLHREGDEPLSVEEMNRIVRERAAGRS